MSEKRITRLMSADDTPGAEQAVISYWERNDVFKRSVDERPESNSFVFYEGPPTANGKPGVHHVLARLSKDLVCRYKTMCGHRVVRKAGWDTHGLPVEIEVEAELGIKRKEQIEELGVAQFNAKCRESVFRYEKEWVKFTIRKSRAKISTSKRYGTSCPKSGKRGCCTKATRSCPTVRGVKRPSPATR
jgi:isoleucyl-tRNA synthetase